MTKNLVANGFRSRKSSMYQKGTSEPFVISRSKFSNFIDCPRCFYLDRVKGLKEPDNSLIKQYVALLKTENVDLEFTEDGIDLIAKVSAEVNASVENIGARRLHTLLEKILDDISFTAPDRSGEKIIIDKKYIENNLGELAKDMDLSKFIL